MAYSLLFSSKFSCLISINTVDSAAGKTVACRSAGLPPSGKKFCKMKKFPGQGKVRELHFQSGKFKKKNEKSLGKVREFQNFPKKMLVNRLLEICFHNLQAILEKECF